MCGYFKTGTYLSIKYISECNAKLLIEKNTVIPTVMDNLKQKSTVTVKINWTTITHTSVIT